MPRLAGIQNIPGEAYIKIGPVFGYLRNQDITFLAIRRETLTMLWWTPYRCSGVESNQKV
jgi:hypothetical protein